MADHGLLFTFGDHIDPELSLRIAQTTDALGEEAMAGVVDLIPSYTTLLVLVEPGTADLDAIVSRTNHHWHAALPTHSGERPTRPEIVIPVTYGGESGPDLAEVAQVTGLSPEEVIRRHVAATYQVGAIGFTPGFAFLIGLPPELAVPRRTTPRTVVPAGSVGIGGHQTGIYSLPTPGGWSLIGQTTATMFAPDREPPSLLQAGDRVRFEAVTDQVRRRASTTPTERPQRAHIRDAFEVLSPGLQTSVQDLGRPGYGRLGVAPGGVLDRGALIAGNRALGNPDDAAGLEITLTGPHLRFLRPGRIVVTGANLGAQLNGMPLFPEAVRVVGPDDDLWFDQHVVKGVRAILCIQGGIEVPVQMESRATDLTAGFGGFRGRALRMGDRLRVGSARRVRRGPDLPRDRSVSSGPALVRIVRGPQADRFSEATFQAFLDGTFTVSSKSNRMGIRLDGPRLMPTGGADIISEGMVTGAIQVTGEGQPIVMLAARATIGGYPRIAVVIAADLDRLGQLRPGEPIRFVEVAAGFPNR